MDDILLILHLLGFGGGMTAAVAGGVLQRAVMGSPADAPVIAKLQPMFVRAGEIGLVLLWITGPWMVATKYAGFGSLPWTFWVKFVCVVGVTAGVIMLDVTGRQARAGSATARARLPIYGGGTGVLLLLVVIFAVVTFH